MRSSIHFRRSEVGGRLLAVILAVLVSGVPVPALARGADAPVSEEAREQARAKFAEGTLSYDLGEFETALKAFSEAYRLAPLPGFLFNVAQCHRQLGNASRAAFFYRRYLALSPEEPANAGTVRELVAEMDTKARAQEAQRQEQSRAARDRELQQAREKAARAEAEAAARRRAQLEAEQHALSARTSRALTAPEPTVGVPGKSAEVSGERPWTRRWYVWAGAGAVALLAGGAVWAATSPDPRPTSLGNVGARR